MVHFLTWSPVAWWALVTVLLWLGDRPSFHAWFTRKP